MMASQMSSASFSQQKTYSFRRHFSYFAEIRRESPATMPHIFDDAPRLFARHFRERRRAGDALVSLELTQ